MVIEVCEKAGFRIQHSKTEGPCRNIEFLGIYINTEDRYLQISYERMCEILDLLREWSTKTYCSKRELLSLIGKLSFCSRVIDNGRRFIRRLIGLSRRMKNLYHKTKITAQAFHDIGWWLASIKTHNGVSMFPGEWLTRESVCMYTDASDIAAGVFVEGRWTYRPFSGQYDWLKLKTIAFRELYAVVLGVALFGPSLRDRKLSMYIDNSAVQHCVNTGTCKEFGIMGLLRSLYYYTGLHNINYRSFYISTTENVVSDAISRENWRKFREVCPSADVAMTPPIDFILDF